jgi:hypothetical protein
MLRIKSVFILASLMALLPVCVVLSQELELVAQWPLDETSGDVVQDIIGGRDGEIINSELSWVPAKFENGLQFDGKGVVEVTKDPELELTDSVTLTAWVKFDDLEGRQDIVSYADSYAIMKESDNTLRGFIYQGAWPMANGATAAEADQWYFAAMTYDSMEIRIYVNGELDGSVGAPGEIQFQEAPFWFGGAPADQGQPWFFKGILDEVEIWSRAMTEEEVMEVYQNPPISSPVDSKGKLATRWGDLKSQ